MKSNIVKVVGPGGAYPIRAAAHKDVADLIRDGFRLLET